MKHSEYAKQQGMSYRTAFRWWQAGQILGYQAPTGAIIVQDSKAAVSAPQRVALYSRVSSHEHQANLDRQAERLATYCAAKGYQMSKIIKKIASGVNDSRPKLFTLLEDQAITLIAMEHEDRLTRFGYLDTLLRGQGRALEVVNEAGNETEDLMADLTAILYSFTARLYRQRRAKRTTETVIRTLEALEAEESEEPDAAR